jgi:hypothetical protein
VTALPIAAGVLAGALIWWGLMRPRQLDEHERRRREHGLPRRRALPEDD